MTNLKNLMNLSGRRALITGAAGGLGRTMADSLAELGSDLVLVDMSEVACDELSCELTKKHGVTVHVFICDLEKD